MDIKAKIKERLKNAPKFPTNCYYCQKYAATFTRPMMVIHFDCWMRVRPLKPTLFR